MADLDASALAKRAALNDISNKSGSSTGQDKASSDEHAACGTLSAPAGARALSGRSLPAFWA